MHKFVTISNRLPVTVSKRDGSLEFTPSSGGLSTAMSSLDVEDMVWIGWPGIASDDLSAKEQEQIRQELAASNCIPVFLSASQVELFYEGYANDTLWPLFHYFPNYAKHREDYWRAYREVNACFADAASAHAANDATIWVHDYHFLLAPGMIRAVKPDARIGLFLHIPFPSYELFRLLPESAALLEGMLGADLLGFHIYDYARHFISSATRILGVASEQGLIEYEGNQTRVDAFPIGIDYQKFCDSLNSKQHKEETSRLAARYGNQKLLLSMDRLDYSKGILKRLEAYERFLEEHPEFIGRVTMLMIAVPSRTEVDTYRQLRDAVEQTVSRINGRFGRVDWAPISYQFQNLPFHEIVALMARADVALVTPLRDGMNLVAKEYVASKQNTTGVLILSETTGAAEEMLGALIANPNDIPSLARKIHRALTMPASERRKRLRPMQRRISEYTVQAWGKDFLAQLTSAGNTQAGLRKKRLTGTELRVLTERYTAAPSRLILLDYDGTLKQFSSDISEEASRPDTSLKRQLARLAKQPGTTVCIISGRSRDTLEAWFSSIPDIELIAEHGAWTKRKGTWHSTAKPFDKKPIMSLMKQTAARTPGAIVEEKDFAVVWHYRQVSPELAYIRNFALHRELTRLTADSGLTVHKGNKIIEVKPRDTTKGKIAAELAAAHPDAFIICAGDDYTDEDMFRSLPDSAYTIKVGFGSTHANRQVETVARMRDVIKVLSKLF